jgi:hypothetical protein
MMPAVPLKLKLYPNWLRGGAWFEDATNPNADIPIDTQVGNPKVEFAADGWMILIPHNLQEGTLQWCSPATTEPEDWLEQSNLIAPQISGLNDERCFNVAPTIELPMCGQTDEGGWIIAGEQAANLDPISGEGTPFSLRSAILAAAAIEAIRDNRIDANGALLHYQSRLTKTFIEHLKGYLSYYHDTFGHHPNWQDELSQTQFLIERLESVTQPESVD